jgi:elongation factor G
VFFGMAERDHGVRRLLKALRHEVPGHEATAARLGLPTGSEACALVFKTYHQPHTGKLSLARVWSGRIEDGMTLAGSRIAGLFQMRGHELQKLPGAGGGEVVAIGRMDPVKTGQVLSASGKAAEIGWPATLPPLFSLAIEPENRADEVKLSASLQKLTDEDPSLSVEHNAETHEMLLWGQGEIHLQIALDRLKNKYNMPVKSRRPTVGYKETIRRGTTQHSRFKRQSGGHGQFADVHVEIQPQPRGTGFQFTDRVVGGAIPRQYIPSVEEGVRDYLSFEVKVAVPTEFTAKVHGLVSGRRGQILGFDAKDGWSGWDEVSVYLPQAELHDLIIDLRSLTMGVGTFFWKFDHLQELSGRLADKVVESRAAAAQ